MAIDPAFAAGLGSVLNFVNNERNNATQIRLQHEAQDWNAQQAQQANRWSIEQWNRENAYNDPSAQMQRLRDAGINPALAYASGVFNQAATSPSVQMPDGAKAAHTQAWQNDPMLFAQLDVAHSQKELLDEQATAVHDENKRKNELQHGSLQLQEENIEHVKRLQNYISALRLDVSAETDYRRALTQSERDEQKLFVASFHYRLSNIINTSRITQEQASTMFDMLQSEINRNKAIASEAFSRSKTNEKLAGYYESLINYYDKSLTDLQTAQKNYYDALSNNVNIQTQQAPARLLFDGIGLGLRAINTGLDAYSTIATGGSAHELTKFPFLNANVSY